MSGYVLGKVGRMLKSLGILAAGIFVGAVGMEVVHQTCPEGLDRLYARIIETGRAAKTAFKEGYDGALNPA